MTAREKRALDESLQRKIEQRAYEIWENEGGPHGRDLDHWLRAEAEILTSTDPVALPNKPQRPIHSRPKTKRRPMSRAAELRGRKAPRP
jgi:hypothetical protein